MSTLISIIFYIVIAVIAVSLAVLAVSYLYAQRLKKNKALMLANQAEKQPEKVSEPNTTDKA